MLGAESRSVSETAYRTTRRNFQDGGWGCLAPGIVDGIVRTLKRTRRWKLDGPVLRFVNKHWSQQIAQHVVEIRPCWTKVLTKQDAISLLHFPQMTSLDVSPFLYGFRRREASSELSEEERQQIVEEFRMELDRVTGILSQLPNLTHLDLDASLQQRQGHPFCIEHCEEWRRLEYITSLTAYGAHRVRRPVSWGHQDQEPWYLDQRGEWDATQLCKLIRQFPRLRRLKARTYSFSVPENLSELQRLESLSFEVGGTVEFLLAVNDLAPLEELSAITFPQNRIELLGQLHRLTSLSLYITDMNLLTTPAFFQVMQNLRCLALESERQWLPLPDTFFRRPIKLESLTLMQFQLRGQEILKSLTESLTELTLRCCLMVDGQDFLMELKNVRVLRLMDVFARRGLPLPLSFVEDFCPEIQSLSVIPVAGRHTLESILQLKTLETLELGLSQDSTVAALGELENLPKLRHLSLRVPPSVTSLPSFLSLEFLTNLEILSFSGRKLVALERKRVERILKKARRA